MKLWVTLLLACALVPGAEPVSDRIHSAVRQNDLAGLRSLLKEAGADARDRRGNTPLMLAAGFGSVEAVKAILDAGADVNAVNGVGTTALIWAGHDLAKVRLLTAAGANVNAKTKAGRTALMVAAGSYDSLPAVQFLLDSGADPNVFAKTSSALSEATFRGDAETGKLLLSKTPPEVLKSPLGGFWLTNAAGAGNLELTKLLLGKGIDPNSVSPPNVAPKGKAGDLDLGLFSPLVLAAAYAPASVVASLLEAGANPNHKDARGMTPLALALSTDRPNLDTIRALLGKGADPKIKDKYGDDAFVWARRFQNKGVMQLLGLTPEAPPAVQRTSVPASNPRAAAERAIRLLQTGNTGFLREGGCTACHSQNLTSLAIQAAQPGGANLDLTHEREQLSNTLNFMKQFDVLMPQGLYSPGAPDLEMYALLQLSTGSVPPSLTTDTIAMALLRMQSNDGSWAHTGIPRPPIEDSAIHMTAIAIRVLQQYLPPALKPAARPRLQQAIRWLGAQQPVSTDDLNMQILGLVWSDGGKVTDRVQQLVALQRKDGGWAQTRFLGSDAYATGQSLHTLYTAGMKSSDPVYRRGVEFLLTTQLADGSWRVPSRSPKFQPYFESGFPHGHDQWISSAATAWAATALGHAITPPVATKTRAD